MSYRIEDHKLFKHLPPIVQSELVAVAIDIMDISRGTLMLDDAPEDVQKKIDEIDIDNKEETRERFYKLILTSPLNAYVSSITFPEDLIPMLGSRKNKKLVSSLRFQDFILGFRANRSQELLAKGDYIMIGLDHLDERCNDYKKMGFKFAVWKNVIKIGNNIPSYQSLMTNAKKSATFAAICQAQAIVPIVGFEISKEGSFTLEQGRTMMEKVLTITFRLFGEEHVFLEGLIIQCTTVSAGIDSGITNTPEEIAEATIAAFSKTILTATKGIQIITRDFSEENLGNLNAIINFNTRKKPWLMTFTIGKNLQRLAMKIWQGKHENALLVKRYMKKGAKHISHACSGKQENKTNKWELEKERLLVLVKEKLK